MQVKDVSVDPGQLYSLIQEAIDKQLATWDALRDIEREVQADLNLEQFIEYLAVSGPLPASDEQKVVTSFYSEFGECEAEEL